LLSDWVLLARHGAVKDQQSTGLLCLRWPIAKAIRFWEVEMGEHEKGEAMEEEALRLVWLGEVRVASEWT
jgi:hypothetical protein